MSTSIISAAESAAKFSSGEASATELVRACLTHVAKHDGKINAFTAVFEERALKEAAAVDAKRARGEALPPLAGVPYAVKNLFDVEGVVTLAGSKINRDHPAAARDCALVEKLNAAGAVLVGALNMDEYAFGFTTENTHYGPTRNPHDLSRVAGGSSGGSGSALAAGMVPLTLGTDTNGSIRVPASLNGVFGLKPTYGRLSRRGTYPFVGSLDHVGPLARSVSDLALAYDAMQGTDTLDPAQTPRPQEPSAALLVEGAAGLRVARLSGYFDEHASADALAVVDAVCKALSVTHSISWPQAHIARAAAFVITAAEGSQLHLPDLTTRADDFDPMVRDRFLANALAPAAWVLQAQRFRRQFHAQVMAAFAEADVLIAAATPVSATPIGADSFILNGVAVPSRPSMGLLTQPISFIGLPVVTVPVTRAGLPLGVQIIAKPWCESHALRLAWQLEQLGVVSAPLAKGFEA